MISDFNDFLYENLNDFLTKLEIDEKYKNEFI